MLCCECHRHFPRKKLLPWKLMNCVGSSGITAQLCQQMEFSRILGSWLAYEGIYLPSVMQCWAGLQQLFRCPFLFGGFSTWEWVRGSKVCNAVISEACRDWQGGAEKVGRGGNTMTSLSKFVNYGGSSSLTPRGSQSLMTENHIPLLSAPLSLWKNGEVFAQQLENKCQHLLSKRSGHAWMPKKKNATIHTKRTGLMVTFLPLFLSVAVKMLSTFFLLSKSYG